MSAKVRAPSSAQYAPIGRLSSATRAPFARRLGAARAPAVPFPGRIDEAALFGVGVGVRSAPEKLLTEEVLDNPIEKDPLEEPQIREVCAMLCSAGTHRNARPSAHADLPAARGASAVHAFPHPGALTSLVLAPPETHPSTHLPTHPSSYYGAAQS